VLAAQSRTRLATIFLFAIAAASVTAAQPTPQLSPADLIKTVIHTELNSNGPDVEWKYVLEKEVDGKKETRQVVETRSGSLERLLAINGKPLTDTQQHDELQRLLQLSHSPEQQRKLAQTRKKDADQTAAFLKMIPAAFLFQDSGERAGPNGDFVKLKFRPNPNYRPTTREGKVMHELAGEVWVDTREQRLVAIDGQLLDDVKFGGGLFGHLEKGGRFHVKRTELAHGQWEVTELDVNMRGKALLFKTISVQQKELHHDFERVPAGLTMSDAAAILMNKSLVAEKR
jgi:hypothetical protein